MSLVACVHEYSWEANRVARPDLDELPVNVEALLEERGLSLPMQRKKVKVMVMSVMYVSKRTKTVLKTFLEDDVRSPCFGCTFSWYRDGIQFRDEEKKKGSMLNLIDRVDQYVGR
jgi:hypothetical protein